MKTLNVHEAKTGLSAVLADIEATGESFLVCRRGKPVAELVPHRKRSRLKPHPVMSRIRIKYDPTEPLTEDEWPEDAK
ncbi:MAG: type II toxin-antitoxin system prevent-host-death family antitoxin [Planctomycetes bacterium]|nr:type II toxin-antitoxin system prevent-host-death family antitoxin [Planctomycetota bacterium]